MKELMNEIFGGANPLIFAFWMLIAGISQYLTVYFTSKKKYKCATGTPEHFDLGFMSRDNIQRFVIAFFISYFGLRISDVFFQTAASFIVAVMIGPGSNLIAGFFRGQETKARE